MESSTILRYAIYGLIALAFNTWYRGWAARTGAKKILAQSKAAYSQKHDRVKTNLNLFPDLDKLFYQSSTDYLLTENFKLLGDYENITLSEIFPKFRTMIRALVSDDGAVCAGLYDFRNRSLIGYVSLLFGVPKRLRAIDLETEFSDSTFITTSNTKALNRTTSVPGITRFQYDSSVPIQQLLTEHRKAITAFLENNPSLIVISISSLEDLHDSQDRSQKLKSSKMEKIGYLNEEEIDSMAVKGQKSAAKLLSEEIEKIKKE